MINSIKDVNMPNLFILIEGIDGSGKDSFAQIISNKIKEKFIYNPAKTLSIVGQPMSRFAFGEQVLGFIESGTVNFHKSEIKNMLTQNRIESEEYLKKFNGVTICIRGLLTDLCTYKILLNEEADELLGQTILVDKLIIIDCDVTLADERILKRGLERTWREEKKYLEIFREYYLNYRGYFYKEKIVIKSRDINILKQEAEKLVNEIYEKAMIERKS